MSKEVNIIIGGLTGQGLVLTVRVLATALLAEGKKVLTTDVPPSTHRLSATYSHLRCGEEIYSEVVPEGEADLVIGFEPLECLKVGLMYASEDGLVIMNDRSIETRTLSPDPTKHVEFKYLTVEEILDYFKRVGITNVKHFDASEVAVREAGTLLSLNMVMLGAAVTSGMIPVETGTVEEAIKQFAPRGTSETNLNAFRVGAKTFESLYPG